MANNPRVRHRSRRQDAAAPQGIQDAPSKPAEASVGYEVGYRKPPRKTQFKAGQSGNPRGRPKGAKNLKTIIERELNRKVVIRDDRGRRAVPKSEAVAMQLVKKALEGNDKAIQTLLKLSNELEAALKAATVADAAAISSPEAMDKEDEAILAEYTQQLQEEAFDLDLPELGPTEELFDPPEDDDGT